MRLPTVIVSALSVLVLSAGMADASKIVSFEFDPADFYEFRDLGPGDTDNWSFEGGMFKLHEEYEVEGPPETTLRSWIAADRPSLDAWKSFLGTTEGIGFFNTDLTQTGNGQLWGQTMPAVISLVSVTAPAGWTAIVDGNNAGWEADTTGDFVRPGTSAGTFGFEVEMDDSFVTGADYTLWFGGFNFTGFSPSVAYDFFWGGDANQHSSKDGTPGSGFEASLRLTAIPEPSSAILVLSCIGLLVTASSRRRK